jgi:hypothetical protein
MGALEIVLIVAGIALAVLELGAWHYDLLWHDPVKSDRNWTPPR